MVNTRQNTEKVERKNCHCFFIIDESNLFDVQIPTIYACSNLLALITIDRKQNIPIHSATAASSVVTSAMTSSM